MELAEKVRCRRKYWAGVIAWLTLIYSTLYVMRPVCTFLKATTPFGVLVNTLLTALLGLVALNFFIRSIPYRPLSVFIFIAVTAAYAAGLLMIRNPEEKIHFIEYGILAFLVFRALETDVCPAAAYGLSFLLTAVFGWVDEGIQHLLPNRFYQLEDVLLNAVSGLLALLLIFIRRSIDSVSLRK